VLLFRKLTVDQKIEYIHVRHHAQDGSVSNRGGTTYAFRAYEGGVLVATAQCHTNDNFDKHIARTKSSGRLNSEKYRVFHQGITPQQFKDIVHNRTSDIT